jgi:hypothetical protein
LVIQIQILLDV